MTLSPCLAGTLTFPRPQQLVTTTATANTAMALAATPSYTDDFEQQRNEMKENGIDASMIQSTLPNLTVDRIQTKTKQKHQRKPSTLRAYGVCYYWALSVQMAGKLFCVKSPSSHKIPSRQPARASKCCRPPAFFFQTQLACHAVFNV